MKKILLLLLLIPINVFALSVPSRNAILIDQDSNRILYSKNINEKRLIASTTKIMTAVIAIESGKLDEVVVVDDSVLKSYGSGIYIKPGEELTLRSLVYGLLLRSGNDAALSIAKYVGKDVDKFVTLMNKKAKKIGMKNTTFNNPSGLDQEKGNYSTAYDMAILTSYAMKNKQYRKITSTKKYTLKTNKNVYNWINKNKLLKLYKYTTGGKTGFTEKARRTLVTTATKNNTNLVVVTLNDGNDWKDHENLFEYGFNNYKTIKILKKGQINIYNETFYKDYILYVKNDFSITLNDGEMNSIFIKYQLNKVRNIKNNQKVGLALIYLGDSKVHVEKIYIKER